ncbi:hypothetical protein [Iodobacter sp. BJB302]|uniref:hypothetical protein n=2 Tax=unclassified Iodobacter TaxID=235634 RepID=UPI000C107ABF|nr:hypothetical protein [Iodobacter sp. BJB302]PHU99870.1 hypothetical protein CSQ88_20260 [Iodobacter sp. BJB302]
MKLLLLMLLLPFYVCAGEPLIYADDSYFPVIYKDKEGQSAGVLYQLLLHHAKITGTKLEIEHTSWRRAYEFLIMSLAQSPCSNHLKGLR